MDKNTRSAILNIGALVVCIALIVLLESVSCSPNSPSKSEIQAADLRSEYEHELRDATYESHSEGYSEGHSLGVEEGHEEGYAAGYYEGHSEGYDSGYIDGFEDARNQIMDCLQDQILHDYGFDVADYIDITPKIG